MTDFDILSNNTYMIQSNNGNISACRGVKSAQNKGCRNYTYQKEHNQYTNLAPLKHDTVNFKGQNKKPEKKMSTFAKIGLGILGLAGVVYGGVVTHRFATKPTIEKIANNFSEIFRKDISKKEAEKLAKQYQEIFKTKDKDEFLKKIFEQLKKDYGYEGKELPFVFKDLGKETENGIILAHWNQFWGQIAINTECLKTFPQKLNREAQEKIMSSITHELQHVKQYEYAFRTNAQECLDELSNPEKALETLKFMLNDNYENTVKSLLEKNPEIFKSRQDVEKFIVNAKKKIENNSYKGNEEIESMLEQIMKERREPIKNLFENMSKFEVGSKDYELGQKYIENHKHYICPEKNIIEYRKQLVEAEAYATEPKVKEICNYIASIWRI